MCSLELSSLTQYPLRISFPLIQCLYFLKTSYILFKYIRYTSYSLFSNNTLSSLNKELFLSFLPLSFPHHLLVEVNGFEPMTPSLQS